MSGPSIRCWDCSDKQEYRWYGLCCQLAGERDLCYLIEWAEQAKNGFSIRLIGCEAGKWAIGIQELRKPIEQCVIHFRYQRIHLVSHISESIRWIGSSENLTTHISRWLHMGNVKEAYRSTNKVNYIRLILKHNDWCTGLHYMVETLLYLALQGWYNIDSAKVFNLPTTADTQWNTCRAPPLCLQHCQQEPLFCAVLQWVHHLRETRVCGECRSIKLTSLRTTSEDFSIPNFGQQFCAQIEEDWVHKVSGLVLRYDQNVLIDSIFIKLQHALLFYLQPFHCPTSVEHLGLDCKVEYTNANHGIMPETHNIWVQYTERNLDNNFQG